MPAGPRIKANNVFGLTSDAPLTAGAVTFNSPGLVNLPVVASAHATVTLDPLREFGEPEIVVVTAHTASATVATIIRGQYATLAREHPVNTTWVHAPLDEDFVEILTSITRPADPYRGQMIFEYDTDKFVARSIVDTWVDALPLGAWQAYAPGDSGVTVGNGTRVARFTRIGRTIHWRYQLVWGSTTAFTATVLIGLPAVANQAANATRTSVISGAMIDITSAAASRASVYAPIVSAGSQVQPATDGTYSIDSGSPFVWATGDILELSGTYEAAS